MRYHILNGDVLAEKLPLAELGGQAIIIREAFIEGPLTNHFTEEYWQERSAFIKSTYEADDAEYENQFGTQLKLLNEISENDEVVLWFEDDLFCQTNMWFSVNYLSSRVGLRFFRIFPKEDAVRWSGFGNSGANELIEFYSERHEFKSIDVDMCNQLWKAYVDNKNDVLSDLSRIVSPVFRFLPQVIKAHIERKPQGDLPGRPQQALSEILQQGKTNFYEICDAFWETNAIYGFGDLQVLNMLKEMEIEFSDEMQG